MNYKCLICLFVYFYRFFYKDLEKDKIADQENPDNYSDFYVYYENEKYDISNFINIHPGGKKVLLLQKNKDITELFKKINHSNHAYKLLETMKC